MSDLISGLEVAYHRESKAKGESQDNAQFQIQQYCDARGIKATFFYEQESSRETRPIKEELLQRARRGEIKTIIVWRFDRWARSLPELVMNLQELTDAGVNFISITEGVDLKTSTGKLMLGIIGSFAQFERDLIRERTKAALDAKNDSIEKNGYFITKRGVKRTCLGRPKGSTDKKIRRRSGYLLRYAGKKKGEQQL